MFTTTDLLEPVRSTSEREQLREAKRHRTELERLTAAVLSACVGCALVVAACVQDRPAESLSWTLALVAGFLLVLPLLLMINRRWWRL